MKKTLWVRAGMTILMSLLLVGLLPLAAASGFANPAFEQQWHAAETTVPNFWGPLANAKDGQQEAYHEAPGGQRLVQYFDKARMELTQPGSGTTNGLLTVELISGKRQLGDDLFTQYPPSTAAIAGDATNTFPTYQSLASLPGSVPQDTTPVSRVFNPGGSFTMDTTLGSDPNAAFGSYQTDPGGKYAHNIPKGMWDYLQGLPVAWLNAMGYPITEAFWAKVNVGGTAKQVLIQAYQRRVLTYTPSNPQGFQVEMGNIGQHYYQWRYVTAPDGSNAPTAPTATVASATPAPAASPSATVAGGTPGSGGTVVFTALTTGAHPGQGMIVQVKTTPGAACTPYRQLPGETSSTQAGVTTGADKDGLALWYIGTKKETPKGSAQVMVTCNGVSASTTVPIG